MEKFPTPEINERERVIAAFEEALYAGTNVGETGQSGKTVWLPIENVAKSLSQAEGQAAVARVVMRLLEEGWLSRIEDLVDKFPLPEGFFQTDAAQEAALKGIVEEVQNKRRVGSIKKIQTLCGLTNEAVAQAKAQGEAKG